MKKTKRLLAVVLAIVMTLSGLSLNALAEDSSVSLTGDYYDVDDTGAVTGTGTTDPEKKIEDENSDAYVNMSKTAAATGNDNEYEVTLNVETMEDMETIETTEPVSVVLVFKATNSMDYSIDYDSNGKPISHNDSGWSLDETRWSAMKDAAEDFIEKLLEANPNNQISIVVYGGQEYEQMTLTGLKKKYEVPLDPETEVYTNSGIDGLLKVHETLCDWTSDAEVAIASFDNYEVVTEDCATFLGMQAGSSLQYGLFGEDNRKVGQTANCEAGFEVAIEQLNNNLYDSQNTPYVVYMSDLEATDSYQIAPYSEFNIDKANIDAIAKSKELKETINNCTLYTIGVGAISKDAVVLNPSEENNPYVDEFFYADDYR